MGDETYHLQGSVHGDGDTTTAVRYVDALAAGLRAAGFDAEVTLTRETKVPR